MNETKTTEFDVIDKFHVLVLGILGALWNIAMLMYGQFHNSTAAFWLLIISLSFSFLLVFTSALHIQNHKKLILFVIAALLFIFPYTATCLLLEKTFKMNFEVLLDQPLLRAILYTYFLASLFYIMEVVHFRGFTFYIVFTIGVAFFTQSCIQKSSFSIPLDVTIFYFSVFGWMLFWNYHNHRLKKVTSERIEQLQLLSNAIAHELRTPLGAMVGICSSLEMWMPRFIQLAQKNGILSEQSRETSRLTNIPSVLKRMVRSSEMVVNMLVEKIKNENGRTTYNELCNSKAVIENALATYPFTEEEKQLIEFKSDHPFSFISNNEAMKHVILNLIKNALFQIQKNQKGLIKIWFENHKNKNTLHFKDTAAGIHILDLLKIFDKPIASTSNGMGLGLLFCKLVITNSGGSIFCDSELGQYAEFIITFPHLPKEFA